MTIITKAQGVEIKQIFMEDIEFDFQTLKDETELLLPDKVEIARHIVTRYDIVTKIDAGAEMVELTDEEAQHLKDDLSDRISFIDNELETEKDGENIQALNEEKAKYQILLENI